METKTILEVFQNNLLITGPVSLRRDIDGDGSVEEIHSFSLPTVPLAEVRPGGEILRKGELLPFTLPKGTRIDADGRDTGVRLVDVNNDGKLDCLFSNAERYSLHLFKDMETGWSVKVFDEKRGDPAAKGPVIPPFIRADGTNNGVWFHSGAIWLQNEDTAKLPDGVEKVLFADLLKGK